jgi:outer membrane protein assembly factor BamB
MRGGAPFFSWSVGRRLIVVGGLVVVSVSVHNTFSQVFLQRPAGAVPTTRPLTRLLAATRIAPVQTVTATGEAAEGFVVRKGDPSVADALAVIDESAKDGRWEKTFASVGKVMDSPADTLVRRDDGFYVSARSHVRQLLVSLPAAGRDAYRLFNDGSARKAMAQADSPEKANPITNPVSRLEELFDRYFVTSVGDQIADRLGDAKFESGDFAGAARCWGAISSDYPDTSIPAVRTLIKRAIALSRAARWDELNGVIAQLREKYPDQSVRLGGRDIAVASLLEGSSGSPIASAPAPKSEAAAEAPRNLLPVAGTQPSWQMVFLDDVSEQQLTRAAPGAARSGVSYNPELILPAAATTADRVYLNWLGIGIAVDVQTGKLLWRSEPFNRIVGRVQQMVLTGYDSGESSIMVSPNGDKLLMTNGAAGPRSVPIQVIGGIAPRAFGGRPAQPQFVRMMVRGSGVLTCLSALDGRLIWSSDSDTLPDLCSLSILGEPLVVDDKVYVVATPVYMASEVSLLAISLADGKINWKMTLGSLGSTVNFRGMIAPAKPLMHLAGDRLYVLTGYGALVAVDLQARRVEWVFTHDTNPMASIRAVGLFRGADQEQFGSSMRLLNGILYFKEKGSNFLYAVDTGRPGLVWKRRVDRDAILAAVDSSTIYVVGDEVSAIDLSSLEMRWSAQTPLRPRQFQPLVEGSRAYVYGPRGIYAVDLRNGTTEMFNGCERGGGAVLRVGERLMCLSNRSLTAFDVPQEAGGRR